MGPVSLSILFGCVLLLTCVGGLNMGLFDVFKGGLYDEGNAFQNVAASSRAFCRVAPGLEYLISQLFFTDGGVPYADAQIATDVDAIRVLINGTVKFECSGADAIARVTRYNPARVADTGVLPMFWCQPWLNEIASQDATGYGTLDVDTFTIEIVFGAGSTVDSVRAFHYTGANSLLGDHSVVTTLSRAYGAAGLETITDLPRNVNQTLQAITIVDVNAAGIDNLELRADKVRMAYGPPALFDALASIATPPRGVVANYYAMDFSAPRNRWIDCPPLVMGDLTLNITWTGAPNAYRIILDLVEKSSPKGVTKG